MPFDAGLLSSVALGIALSACCGFRVFLPLLAASLAARLNWFAPPESMEWLGSLPALLSFGTAAALEIGAYYVPFIDNLLDAIATPVAAGAGTLVAASILPADSELLRWGAALVAGGGAAGLVHTGMGLLRLFSTKTTAGTGNAVVTTTENAAAIGGTVLSFLIPLVMAVAMLALIGFIVYRLLRMFGRRSNGTGY